MNSIVPLDNPFKVFNFGDTPIRIILNDVGGPLFIAADVCKALEISNTSDAVSGLDEDERGLASADTTSSQRDLLYITEAGLYSLIFKSRKRSAKDFKRWVTHDVLPTIRKTGQYAIKPLSPGELLVANAQAYLEHERALAHHTEQIDALEHGQTEIRAELDARNEHFTVLAYCRLKGLPAPNRNFAAQIGKRCTTLSKQRGLDIGRITDQHWGWVQTYHESVLAEVIGERT